MEKTKTNILSNCVIVCVVLMLTFVTYLGSSTSVFLSNGYSAFYNGNKENNNVSLMINVYQGEEYVLDMLDILKQKNVCATFFIGGCWAIKNTDVLEKIKDSGQEIGNHGYFHKDHKNISKEQNLKEIQLNHQLVEKLVNIKMNLFAPPSGSYSKDTLDVAQGLGYYTVMWSKDTIDWRDQNSSLIYERATKNAQNGDLILMHPTKCTVEVFGNIIDFYTQNNFNLTTVSQNIF